jgi:short-subunit dehydrogenase
MSSSSSKGTALITGASRGVGAVYANRLAKRGYDLILVARSEGPLQALAAMLSRSTGRRTTPIVADVNNKQDLARVEAKLKDDQSITMLVDNAGCASVDQDNDLMARSDQFYFRVGTRLCGSDRRCDPIDV